ncbi:MULTISPECIES: spermidine synthase [unclassified Pseudoalteromonas]|jgi:spermidine synthase|uniref:spermidine synthase n=1 Tax=unclassified Pseudoalteromonas TaxID=194690 RepID=UPI002358979C|nr:MULTISPECIES: fused MFS/spermidine synthase [unclassified Pseudoalteromonas]MDC9566614.1 fused MFS/spermidine synthase [Pseudoalteromonas sp. GAB2316C]MDC9570462.1 fused MFS/spermidine synthase [Pseudoalteromonas sp. GABNB9D]MDC9574563.1 fused MFS/spermidine synthase [Pseudoalteromonas sp. GABNS16A]MDC9578977.1 fused MFS/spermidine synthase [Pseudoalteromonas sp. GABNS16E]MDC9586609.1 fused MFS/spermidine synthase [Pseudoalteromonas sp. GABNS16C]
MRNCLLFLAVLFSVAAHSNVVHEERSLYRNIIVDETHDLRCLKFNTKSSQTSQSCMYKNNPDKLVFNYTKLTFASLLVTDNPKNVLIIGLGGGTLSNVIHALYPAAKIHNVEIDPAVLKVARNYFNFIENDVVTSSVQDGRIFIKRAAIKKQKYDWIILDAFNGDYIPEHLLTKEFFEEVKSVLAEGGVIAANTFSSSKLYEHESATYHAVFGDFINVSRANRSNRIILAGVNSMPTEAQINQRIKALNPRLKKYDVDLKAISTYMQSTKNKQDWPANTKVLTDQYSPANLLNF